MKKRVLSLLLTLVLALGLFPASVWAEGAKTPPETAEVLQEDDAGPGGEMQTVPEAEAPGSENPETEIPEAAPPEGETPGTELPETPDISAQAEEPGEDHGIMPAASGDYLSELSFGPAGSPFEMIPAFSPSVHAYTVVVPDRASSLVNVRTALQDAPADAQVRGRYQNTSGTQSNRSITGSGHLNACVSEKSLVGTTVNIVVTNGASSGEQIYDTYTVTIVRKPTLSGLSLTADGNPLRLDRDFSADTCAYTADIPDTAARVAVTATGTAPGVELRYNGGSEPTVDVSEIDRITVTAVNGDQTTDYTVELNKLATFRATITAEPADATITVCNGQGTPVAWGSGTVTADGLDEGSRYTVSKYGYVSQTGELTGGKVRVTLAQAPASQLPNYTGDWTSFRGNPENMGITAAPTPVSYETANLKWAARLGSDWANSPTPPLVLNDALYIAINNKVVRMDKETGQVLATSPDLAGNVGFAMNPITYAEGMLFVAITDGRVQALRADTLELLWISEAIGGQTLCPVTYHDGYLYTGTWNNHEAVGSYFCLSVTDEDPGRSDEVKPCTWRIDHTGGFYWAGAYATDNYVIFGSDDGRKEDTDGTSVLYSVDPRTGKIIDTIADIRGDIRSTVSYDKATGSVYCSTKGGLFIKAEVDDSGHFGDHWTVALGGMATGTPLVYDGVAFIGVAGRDQFSASGHAYKLVDVDTMEVIQSVDTIPGYVQTSALLSTAYADQGKVYVYLTYNYKPGGIYALEYDIGTRTARGFHLLKPAGNLSQYCVCSLVCDAEGTIYYKNDSGCIMAVESNEAYLTGLAADAGKGLGSFDIGVAAYELTVPRGTQSVTFAPVPADGASVTLNGGADMTLPLADGTADARFVVTKGADTRTYTVAVREAVPDTALGTLRVNNNNMYDDFEALTPDFDPDTLSYVWFDAPGYAGAMVNVWPETHDPNASVKIFPVSAVGSRTVIAEDGSIPVTSNENVGSHNRYAVYLEDPDNTPTVLRFTVTAEDGVTTRDYFLLITTRSVTEASYSGGVVLNKSETTLAEGGTETLLASVVKLGTGDLAEDAAVTWSSSAPGVADVDQSGLVTAKSAGQAVITASLQGELGVFSASCAVTVTAKAGPEPTPPTPPSPQKREITVSFRLIGSTKSDVDVDVGRGTGHYEYQTWIPTRNCTLPEGSSVYDLFTTVLDEAGLAYEGAESNYVEAIQAPAALGGYELSEFTNGPRSGWMYTLEGVHVGRGLKEQALHDGDHVLWHYVNDYAYEVKDWFNDPGYPGQGNSSTWVDWEKIPDTKPSAPDAGKPGTPSGGQTGPAGEELPEYAPPLAEQPGGSEVRFTDVPGGAWYAQAVEFVAARGLFRGVGETEFAPGASMTRAMLVTVLWSLEDKPAADGSGYTDVPGGAWYAQAVTWAAGQSIVSGLGDGSFAPGAPITREQLALMLFRYAQTQGADTGLRGELDAFADTGAAHSWAKEALGWAVGAGLMAGKGGAILDPAGTATRAEVAAMTGALIRLLNK